METLFTKKSFTLIEILVVIVVIGVLSAFILVGMSSITSSANITRGKAFVNSLDNSLLLARVSQWKFDESSIPTAYDSWGTNNGTLKENGYAGVCDITHCPQIQTTGCASNNCLLFDGTNDYVEVAAFDYAGTNDFTIGSWVNWSGWGGGNIAPIYYYAVSSHTLAIEIGMTSTGKFTWHITKPSNTIRRQRTTNISVPKNVWKYVIITKTGDNDVKAYIDGIENTSREDTAANTLENDGTVIGRQLSTSFPDYLAGKIDDVRIYNQAMPTSQINQNYYSGLSNLLVNNSLERAEYIERLSQLKSNLSEY